MLGAITGDIVGSVYEFHNYKAKDFEPFFSINSQYTDDTICTIAIADALLNNISPVDTLRHWGRKYWSNGGWGQKFALWLSSSEISPPYNSYGNGAAMRVSPCAWLADTHKEAIDLATQVTKVTHNHPEGIKGAHAVTSAIFWARNGYSHYEIRQMVTQTYHYNLTRSVDDIRLNNPHSEACQNSVPEAITCAIESNSFEDAIRNAISIGGDSDTIAAIAGSIAEAMYKIPEQTSQLVKSQLPDEMLTIINQFYNQLEPTV